MKGVSLRNASLGSNAALKGSAPPASGTYRAYTGGGHVRFGSKADMWMSAKGHKRTYVATTPDPSLTPQNLSSCVAHITLKRADRE